MLRHSKLQKNPFERTWPPGTTVLDYNSQQYSRKHRAGQSTRRLRSFSTSKRRKSLTSALNVVSRDGA